MTKGSIEIEDGTTLLGELASLKALANRQMPSKVQMSYSDFARPKIVSFPSILSRSRAPASHTSPWERPLFLRYPSGVRRRFLNVFPCVVWKAFS